MFQSSRQVPATRAQLRKAGSLKLITMRLRHCVSEALACTANCAASAVARGSCSESEPHAPD
ncbi:hypothetical protein TR80_021920 [Xanthomonas campestris]|nr:hypothetical protein TR80_021920 [Xanthomonas campestris]